MFLVQASFHFKRVSVSFSDALKKPIRVAIYETRIAKNHGTTILGFKCNMVYSVDVEDDVAEHSRFHSKQSSREGLFVAEKMLQSWMQ